MSYIASPSNIPHQTSALLPPSQEMPEVMHAKVPPPSSGKPMPRAAESTMRAVAYGAWGNESSDRKRIQSPNSNVSFECLSASDIRDEITYLSKMHEKWLAASPSYAKLIAETTANGRSIKVQINNEYRDGARVTWDEDEKEHLIEINPLGHEVDADEPLNDDERKSMACLCLFMELRNAATMDEFAGLFERAKSGEFVHRPIMENQAEIEKQLMRHENDRFAIHYACAIEHQEYENTQAVLKIVEELRKTGISSISDEHRDELRWESFGEYLKVQIENEHTQPYLDTYDDLISESAS